MYSTVCVAGFVCLMGLKCATIMCVQLCVKSIFRYTCIVCMGLDTGCVHSCVHLGIVNVRELFTRVVVYFGRFSHMCGS
jgi:hypothetical protein